MLWLTITLLIGTPLAFSQTTPMGFEKLNEFLKTSQSHKLNHPTRPKMQNHYYSLQPDRPEAYVFLPGMGEAALKYYDLFEKNLEPQITYYFWDHLGQGFSSSLIPEEPKKVHIDSFDTHLVALNSFLKTLKKKHTKIHLIGHSMGGHLALRWALENPKAIHRLILSAPMIDINRTWVPVDLISWIFEWLPPTSYPPFYFLFTKKSEDGSFVTNSLERQQWLQQLFKKYPMIQRQGATVGWIQAARASIENLSQVSGTDFETPVLILQAEHDYLVDNQKQADLCDKFKNCQLHVIRNSKHEILFEDDTIRNQALEQIKAFVNPRSLPLKTSSGKMSREKDL